MRMGDVGENIGSESTKASDRSPGATSSVGVRDSIEEARSGGSTE